MLPGDTEKVAWDSQVRDAMRVLATTKILHEDEHALDSLELEAPAAQSLFDITFTLFASLSLPIERSRKQTVNKAIAGSSTLNPTLFGKEDLAILRNKSRVRNWFYQFIGKTGYRQLIGGYFRVR